ncbi:MAG: hypothetical protein UY63_C0001G0004 [Parcubacteria group bacterium GW2011_GWA2_51_10]|nr:MAG: hypothetical protein UY63_C0001G0004 [Parcubacteria group bacterium GW2011_GWA2_51_10]
MIEVRFLVGAYERSECDIARNRTGKGRKTCRFSAEEGMGKPWVSQVFHSSWKHCKISDRREKALESVGTFERCSESAGFDSLVGALRFLNI